MAGINQDNAGAGPIEESRKHIDQIIKGYQDAGIALNSLNNDEKELLNLSKLLENSLANIVKSMVLRNNESKTVKQLDKQIFELTQAQERMVSKQVNLSRSLTTEITTQNSLKQKANDLLNINTNQSRALYELQREAQAEYEAKSITVRDLQNQIARTNDLDLQKTLRKRLEGLRLERQDYKENLVYANEQVSIQEKLEKQAANKLYNLEESKKSNDDILANLVKELKLAKEIRKETILEEASKKIKGAFDNQFTKLVGILGLNQLVKTLFEADTQVTNLAENLGISRKSARGIRDEFTDFVVKIKDGSISVKDMFEAQANMSKELGTAVRYSDKELQTFNQLTKLMGVSVKAASKLKLLSAATNNDQQKYIESALLGANDAKQAIGKQVAVSMSAKDVLEEIGTLSSSILIKFQANPEALGKAVVEAKRLGLSLEQVDKIGESLLNWESSIESTLKAELLTGRQLNLERVRAAALTGDQSDLMKEISEQMGTEKDFLSYNVLARKSLAEAFGLTVDEMSDMLLKQDLINDLGDKANELTIKQAREFKESGKTSREDLGKFIADQATQVSLQEKMNTSIDKFKQLFIQIADGPFGTMVESLTKMLGHTTLLKNMFSVIGGIISVQLVGSLIKSIQAMGKLVGLARLESIFTTWTTAQRTAGLATIFAVGAGLTAISMIPDATPQKIEDGIAPSSNGPFTITDKFGGTAITTEGDGIAVSPNINKESSNNTALEDKLDRLISLHQQHLEVAKSGTTLQINEFALGKASPVASAKENSRNFY